MTEPIGEAPLPEFDERQIILPPPLWNAVVQFLADKGFAVRQIPNLEDPIPTYSAAPAEEP